MVATLRDISNVMWEVNDQYHNIKCLRIPGFDEKTDWGMVYKQTGDEWVPCRPVSTKYQPVSTGGVVEAFKTRFSDILIDEDENVRLSGHKTSTAHSISLRIDKPFEVDVPIRDHGKFTRYGEKDVKTDLWFPTFRATNAYDGTKRFELSFGFERLVCKNGMRAMVPGAGFSTGKVLHFNSNIQEALNQFENFEFDTNIEMVQDVLKKMGAKKMGASLKAAMEKALPKKYVKEFQDEYKDHTLFGAMNYITYLQTHVYDEFRNFQLQPVLNAVMKAAA